MLYLIVFFLVILLWTLFVQLRETQQRLRETERLLEIQRDLTRHYALLATGGVFASFIDSLDLSCLEHQP